MISKAKPLRAVFKSGRVKTPRLVSVAEANVAESELNTSKSLVLSNTPPLGLVGFPLRYIQMPIRETDTLEPMSIVNTPEVAHSFGIIFESGT